MSIVPSDRLAKIEFFEARIQTWVDNAESIGLTPEACAVFESLIEGARATYNAAQAARAASKAATSTYYNGVRSMGEQGTQLIRVIRNYAESTGDVEVWAKAALPAPVPPSQLPPPGTPYAYKVGLLETGAITLRWKCDNPAGANGTIYEVFRRTGIGGAFLYVGATGEKSFTDATIPAGTATSTYQVTAIRSTVRGNPSQFTVNFGVGGGGGMTIASLSGAEEDRGAADGEVKMAA